MRRYALAPILPAVGAIWSAFAGNGWATAWALVALVFAIAFVEQRKGTELLQAEYFELLRKL